jgi:transposase
MSRPVISSVRSSNNRSRYKRATSGRTVVRLISRERVSYA